MGDAFAPSLNENLTREESRRQTGRHILKELALLERWQRFGRPVLVGAMAYDLVMSPDIDLEISCPELRIEHGFEIIRACALHPNVTKARFSNELAGRDRALYWQLRYRAEESGKPGGAVEWKIDMWALPQMYELPRSESLVAPMRAALTPESRTTILHLKEMRDRDPTLQCPSIDLYRAVLDDGVQDAASLRAWLADHEIGSLTDWKPSAA